MVFQYVLRYFPQNISLKYLRNISFWAFFGRTCHKESSKKYETKTKIDNRTIFHRWNFYKDAACQIWDSTKQSALLNKFDTFFFNRPRYFPNIVPWRLVHFLPLLGQKSKDIDKILVDFVNFRKFSQLWGALSPSSKRVMSSDRYRCQGMPMNFAAHLIPSKTGTWRKS